MAIEAIAREHSFPPFRKAFQGAASEGRLGGERVALLMPQTFMNESGRSVGEACRFFKIEPRDVTVFHDELDLAPSKLRIKIGGGNAGHNGLRSITAHIGNDYKRVRLGIGHPGDKAMVHSFVLSDFGKPETEWAQALCAALARDAELLVRGDDAGLQNKVHLAMEAAGFIDAKRPSEPRE
jgi:PTH1 family peptidyl-tRNA hydrolase